MNVPNALRSPGFRGGVQILVATCLGAMAVDLLIGAVGSVRSIGMEDVPGLVTALLLLIAGLIVGHVVRRRLPVIEWVSAPIAIAGAVMYAIVELNSVEPGTQLAISCVLMGAYTTSLSLVDAFPGGSALEARRGSLLDDGATLSATLVASTLATPVFISSPLIYQGWIVPAVVLGAAGLLDLLVAVLLRRVPDKEDVPAPGHPLLAILRGHMMALGILVYLVGAFELDWILGELFGSMYMYAVYPQVLVKACILAAALGGCITGAAAAKACLLAGRKAGRVVGSVFLVLVPLVIAGAVLPWAIVEDVALPGAVALFLAVGHVTGLILQFTDAGYKGMGT